MKPFRLLQVRRIDREAGDAVVIEFDVPPALVAEFSYVQGQYLTLRTSLSGEDVRRCYSICAGAHERALRVAVKKIPGGRFSGYATDALRVGDILSVAPPAGGFHTPLAPGEARRYIGVAAGSGITPILSHIETILQVEKASTFTLFYVNRTRASTMFAEKLADLVRRHGERLIVRHYLTRETTDAAEPGRPDPVEIFAANSPASAIHAAFVCGPAELVDACRAAALASGLDASRFRSELFVAPPTVEAGDPAIPAEGPYAAEVEVCLNGDTARFRAASDGPSLLDLVLEAGLDAPHSCCMGVCDTCRALLRRGAVSMETNYALTDEDVARGFILTCQARPASDEPIVLDFDAVAA